ncbi:hypothetical protein MiTe_00417 [Microcystis aeruginosa NIES-2520]|jgi:hypothetical protein|uniref:Uncharacterized protein n=1 Tax=Microcystis aeruginosa NIES-2520 TaxID=2303982 RepID=A0A5A5RC27_MICAE|nr:hypothetical protein MiTe_00417 [Microcystis aeruginosa NIES-2520]
MFLISWPQINSVVYLKKGKLRQLIITDDRRPAPQLTLLLSNHL